MEKYSGLARIYDFLVSGVDFEGWIDYAESLMEHFNLDADIVVDIACGTGNTTIPFAQRGYKAYGLDLSEEMIELARQKSGDQKLNIEFYRQDMRNFSLPVQADLATCFHDGLNYLLNVNDIKSTFISVNDNLKPGGSFIFDLNSVTWLADIKNEVTVIDDDEVTLIWETSYNHPKKTWEIKVIGFIKEGPYYKKIYETHNEKGYGLEEISECLLETGFTLLGCFDAFNFAPAHNKSLRHFYIAKKVNEVLKKDQR